MAAPSYTTDLTTIVDFDGTPSSPTVAEPSSGWIAGRSPTTDTDFPIQGSNHASLTMNTTGKAGILCTNASSWTWNSSHYLFGWIVWLAPGAIANKSSGGVAMLAGNTAGDYKIFYVGGKDFGSYPYGGWQCFIVDPTHTGGEANNGSPNGTNFNFVGAGANVLSAVSKGNPLGFDVFRYGRGEFRVVAGESGNYATFAGMATTNDNTSNRWGLFQAIDGGYRFAGHMILGYGALVNFVDSNKSIVVQNTPEVNSDFHKIEIRNSSSVISWDNISIAQLGVTGTYTTASKCNLVVTDNATISMTNCTFTDMSTFAFLSGLTATGCTWRRCGQISVGTGNAPTMTYSLIAASTAAADTSALQWNCTQGPNGKLDGSTFTKGTNAHHAIEFGTNSPTSMTLTDITFTGFNASNSQNDSALHIKRTAGTVTIYIVGGTTPSYKSDGATVSIIANPVNVTLIARNTSGSLVSGATVLVKADSGGPFPVGASVTISNNSTTATVTHSNHGMATNDKVLIKGASHYQNNGVFEITYISDNSYSYTMSSAPGSSPTGTITSTFVILSGTTDGSGEITMSRVFSSSQPFSGWARKSSATPFYKTGVVSGSVSPSSGASVTALLLPDE